MTDFFGTLLTGLGLRSTDPNKKYKYYRVAIYAFTACVICLFLALIIYPTSFSKDMENEKRLDGGRVQAPRNFGSLDFDGDGIYDHLDDGDDNDGLKDDVDNDDDNDGIPDAFDNDTDGDGQIDAFDNDDDGDGIEDSAEYADSDGVGTPDNLDNDDDNDGIPDTEDSLDSDGDGISDEEDGDDDGDGIADHSDNDDDNDGIPDSEDLSGHRRVWEFGFGFGASWCSLIFIFVSLVLLI